MKSMFTIKGNVCGARVRLGRAMQQPPLTQEELANILEVSRQTVNSLEKGRYNPSITLAFKIARHFNMAVEEIFIYEEC